MKKYLLIFMVIYGCRNPANYAGPRQDEQRLLRKASLIAVPSTNRVDAVVASVRKGNTLTQYWASLWQSNVINQLVINLTNAPLNAPVAKLQISYEQPVSIRTKSKMDSDWNTIKRDSKVTIEFENEGEGYFQVSIPNQTATLLWSPSPTPTVVGYTIYVIEGTNEVSAIGLGNVTNHVVSGLEPDHIYSFEVSARDGEGKESLRSGTVHYVTPVPEIRQAISIIR